MLRVKFFPRFFIDTATIIHCSCNIGLGSKKLIICLDLRFFEFKQIPGRGIPNIRSFTYGRQYVINFYISVIEQNASEMSCG